MTEAKENEINISSMEELKVFLSSKEGKHLYGSLCLKTSMKELFLLISIPLLEEFNKVLDDEKGREAFFEAFKAIKKEFKNNRLPKKVSGHIASISTEDSIVKETTVTFHFEKLIEDIEKQATQYLKQKE